MTCVIAISATQGLVIREKVHAPLEMSHPFQDRLDPTSADRARAYYIYY